MSKKYITDVIKIDGQLLDGNGSAGTSGQVLSSTGTATDWVSLSEISGVDGSGNENYVAKWSDTDTITGSIIYDNGTNVGIGATSPLRKLHVAGGDGFAVNASTSQYYGVYIPALGEGANPRIDIGDWHNAGATISWNSSARSLNLDTQYSTGAGTFNITGNDGASTFFTINTSGNVGIGTTNPATKLAIQTSNEAISVGQTSYNYTSKPIGLQIAGWDATYTNAAGVKFHRWTGSANDYNTAYVGQVYNGSEFVLAFRTDFTTSLQDAQSDRMVITSAGNVGIGTASPGTKLHIQGINSANGGIRIHNNGGNPYSIWSDNDKLYFSQGNGSTTAMSISYAGNVGIGTTNPGVKFQVGDPGDTSNYVRVRTATSDVYVGANPSSTHIGINNGGKILQTLAYPLAIGTTENQELYLGANNAIIATLVDGKFGIGTTSPGYKLDVNGITRSKQGFMSHVGIYTGGGTYTNQWQEFARASYSTFSLSGFKLSVQIIGDTSNVNTNAEIHINWKFQSNNGRIYANIINYGENPLTANDFEIYRDGTNNQLVFYHRIIKNYSQPIYTVIGESGLVFSSSVIGASLSGVTNDAFTEKTIRDSMTIESDTGYVGIGTTDPQRALEVNHGAQGVARFVSTSTTNAFIDIKDANTTADNKVRFGAVGDALTLFSGGSERIRIASLGNVGIGTTSPLDKLSVEGNSSNLLKIRNTTNAGGASIEFNDNGGSEASQNGTITYYHSDAASQSGGASFWFEAEPDTVLVIGNGTNTGRIAVSSQNSSAEVDYGFRGNVNTGMYSPAADQVGLVAGGSRKLLVSGDGVTINNGRLYLGGTVDTNTSSTTALVLNGTEVEKRTLGSAAFSNTGDFAAASHTHAASDITSGTFADARIALSNITQHTDPKYLRSNAADVATSQIQLQATNNIIRIGNTNNTSTAETTGLNLHGNYTTGQYAHRLRKYDHGGGVPLYIDGSGGTANIWTSLARFGTYSGNGYEFEVFGDINATGTIYDSGNRVLTTADEGSGNGLDSDTLDGNHASAFALSSHTHDDRYYTETEIGNFFSGATAITGYSKTNWDSAYTYSQVGHLSLAGGTLTGTLNIGAASTDAAGIHLIYSASLPEIRIQTGENGATAFSIYNTATSPDSEQFFINNTLSTSHLGNARGALKLETNSGVVLTLNGTATTLAGDLTVNGGDITLGGTGRIQGIDTVSVGTDAANKTYVDNAVFGLVDGSGTAGHVAFWSDSDTITGESNLFWDATNNRLGVGTAGPGSDVEVAGLTQTNKFRYNYPTADKVYSGEIAKFGTVESSSAGDIVFLNSSGKWVPARADTIANGAINMLGFYDGTDVIIRGPIRFGTSGGSTPRIPAPTPTPTPGQPLYLSPDVAGEIFAYSQLSSFASGEFIRIIGHIIDYTNDVFYFNPDSTWVEKA